MIGFAFHRTRYDKQENYGKNTARDRNAFMLGDIGFARSDDYARKAQGYQREAEYYTRRGDIDRATTRTRYSKDAMGRYETQLKYASDADEKAAVYLRRAAEALKKR